MLRKIFRIGNSTVTSIPKEPLDYLRLQEGAEAPVELDRANHQIVIEPVKTFLTGAGVDEGFARQVDAFIEQYRSALESLARKCHIT